MQGNQGSNPGTQQSSQPALGWTNDSSNQQAPQNSGFKKRNPKRQFRGNGRGGTGYRGGQGNQNFQRNVNAVGMAPVVDLNAMYGVNPQMLTGQGVMPMQALPAGQYAPPPAQQQPNNFHFGGANQHMQAANVPMANQSQAPRGISGAQAAIPMQAAPSHTDPQRVGNLQLYSRVGSQLSG